MRKVSADQVSLLRFASSRQLPVRATACARSKSSRLSRSARSISTRAVTSSLKIRIPPMLPTAPRQGCISHRRHCKRPSARGNGSRSSRTVSPESAR